MARKSRPEVRTTAGVVRGAWKSKGEVAVFRGVPFAAPPVDERRWRPPEPVEPWAGVREATKDGPTAIQRAASFDEFLTALVDGQGWNPARAAAVKTVALKAPKPKESEDCLYLSVRTPELSRTARLPVMVWIHGGDHQDGSGSDVFYASNALAEHGVVTVSINYRLGLLGYFAHPELSAESEHGVSGNYGLLDQVAALEWVRDNIEAFGGDPDRVTIFGESAGGESVMQLMVSPLARGLFHQAIAESPANTGQMIHLRYPFLDFDAAEVTGLAVAEALGITGAEQLARLRQQSSDDLYSLVRSAPRLGDHYPVIDGWALPESPLAAFAGGRQAKVPLTIGTTTDEGSLLTGLLNGPMVEYRYRYWPPNEVSVEAVEAFGDDLKELAELYPGLERRDPVAETDFFADYLFGSRAHWYAEHHSAAGHPVWSYRFARVPPSPKQTAGAYHAAELPFVHGTSTPVLPLSKDDKVLAAAVQAYWTSFARTGNPNSAETSVQWPKFDRADPQWLVLDHDITAAPVDLQEKFDVLNRRTDRLVGQMSQLGSTSD